jgi:hypothetical protein
MKNYTRFIYSKMQINKKEVLLNKPQYYLEDLDKVLKMFLQFKIKIK